MPWPWSRVGHNWRLGCPRLAQTVLLNFLPPGNAGTFPAEGARDQPPIKTLGLSLERASFPDPRHFTYAVRPWY